jgi:hypothetical protein
VAKGPTGPARQTTTSFADAPAGYGGGATGAIGGGGLPPGAPVGAAPGGGAAGAAGGAAGSLPAPINRGVRPQRRSDPFVSFRILRPFTPPAFTLTVPFRLASYPRPVVPKTTTLEPELLFGPLPPVERRVAGVLHNGSVSAILETGTPGGAGTDVRVIQPGQTVPSGIPGVDDLTVSSVTPTGILLRANDGRTVNVSLSNVPAAYADAFRNAVSGPGGVGGVPGGGPPGGPFGPGGGPPPGAFGPGGVSDR